MAPHSSTLAWKIPWTEEPGRLQSMGSVLNLLSHVRLSVTRWTVAHQTPQSLGFSRQEYCSELPFPSPGDPPDLGIESASLLSLLHWQAGSLPLRSLLTAKVRT